MQNSHIRDKLYHYLFFVPNPLYHVKNFGLINKISGFFNIYFFLSRIKLMFSQLLNLKIKMSTPNFMERLLVWDVFVF